MIERRLASACALALALLSGCATTPAAPTRYGRQERAHEFEFATGISTLPGVGTFVGVSQRIWDGPRVRADFETELVYQALDDDVASNGDVGDDLGQFRFGLRFRRPGNDGPRWIGRFGGTWMRFQGDPVYLDDPRDYGGVYLGVGYEFPLGKRWITGPHVTVHFVASEGVGDSGAVPEAAWRFAFKL